MDKTTELIFNYLKDTLLGTSTDTPSVDLEQLPIKYIDLTTGLQYLQKYILQNREYMDALCAGDLSAKQPDEINEITKGGIALGEKLNDFSDNMKSAENGDFLPLGNSFGKISRQYDRSILSALQSGGQDRNLLDSKERFSEFLSIMPSAVCLFVFDEFLSISAANKQFYESLGYVNEELAKSSGIISIQRILSEEESLKISDILSETIANEESFCEMLVHVDFNGENVPFLMKCRCTDISSEYYYICAEFEKQKNDNSLNTYSEQVEDLQKQVELAKNENVKQRIVSIMEKVQPHFLYNALSSIRTIVKTDPDYAYDLLYDFSIYLRGKLRALMSDDMITFEEEMANINAYLNMEQMRFGDKLKVETDILVDKFMIVPFSVQAIVEHSVRYCIYQRGSKGGTVSVVSREDDSKYIIEVSDDGIGFDMDSIPEKDKEYKNLQMTIDNLKTEMNAETEINSGIGIGTRITIMIPKK